MELREQTPESLVHESALRCGVTMQQWIKSALERETRLA